MENNQSLKLQKKKLREEKEIAYLLKEKSKPKFKGYLFLFLFIITLVYLVDEVTTNIGKFMELDVAVAFFGGADTYDAATTTGLIGTLITAVAGCAMFLRPLADRFGRKFFLYIYTFGMSIAMFIIAVSVSIPGWVVGTILIQICIPHDMQQVYIQECAPKEKRGTYFSVIKGLATFGLILVPILRKVFNVDQTPDNWRLVYNITAIVGFVSVILAIVFMRESDVYIDNRLHQLRMTDEEKLIAKKEKSDEAKRGGIINGFIYIFKHKQLRWITISMMLAMMAYVLTDHYSAIMGLNYLESVNLPCTSSNYRNPEVSRIVTNAIFFYPIGCGLVEILPGIIADKIGRKKTSIFFGAGALLFYVLFYVGSMKNWPSYFNGFFLGASCGAVWSFGDLLLLMITESSETNLRVSANTTCLFAAGLCYTIAKTIIESICKGMGSDKNMGILTIIVVIVGLTASVITTTLKVKETKGVDLNTIKAKDYE